MSVRWKRTHTCGELREDQLAQSVTLNGWVHRRRDHGGVVFIDLRDRYDSRRWSLTHKPRQTRRLRSPRSAMNSCSVARAKCRRVPTARGTPNLPTGDIEVHATTVQILSATQTPPFDLNNPALEVDESIRLRYRYLDLRRKTCSARWSCGIG